MQVRLLTALQNMETIEFKKLLREIGDSVHSMNTIAVGLSKLNIENMDIPEGLDISWKPKEPEISKNKARNYAEKAAIIYSVESFFEYLESVSENPFWSHNEINFRGDEKKADRVYNFLNQIPTITDEMAILSELACHWRNKIVHASASKAKLANEKIGRIRQLKESVYENYYHFDTDLALVNYESKKITLKDSSTLITILIKSARLIDEFFFKEFSLVKSLDTITTALYEKDDFIKITNQQDSKKRKRQILTFIQMSYPFLTDEHLNEIIRNIELKLRP